MMDPSLRGLLVPYVIFCIECVPMGKPYQISQVSMQSFLDACKAEAPRGFIFPLPRGLPNFHEHPHHPPRDGRFYMSKLSRF